MIKLIIIAALIITSLSSTEEPQPDLQLDSQPEFHLETMSEEQQGNKHLRVEYEVVEMNESGILASSVFETGPLEHGEFTKGLEVGDWFAVEIDENGEVVSYLGEFEKTLYTEKF